MKDNILHYDVSCVIKKALEVPFSYIGILSKDFSDGTRFLKKETPIIIRKIDLNDECQKLPDWELKSYLETVTVIKISDESPLRIKVFEEGPKVPIIFFRLILKIR